MRKLKLDELGRPGLEEFKDLPKIPIVVVLDNLRSGMNVGSFFRTCDAFKINRIVLCGITARPPHKEILKTAIGATESVEWSYVKDIDEAISKLKSNDYKIVGIEQTNQSVSLLDYEVDQTQKYAIVFGNEVHGIDQSILKYLDVAIEIPQFGTKHSLNVSVCGGIVLWHFAKPFLK